jgi:hypothetical protein
MMVLNDLLTERVVSGRKPLEARVVYESMFGNTETVARAVAGGLADHLETEVCEIPRADDGLGGIRPDRRRGTDTRFCDEPTCDEGTAPRAGRGLDLP